MSPRSSKLALAAAGALALIPAGLAHAATKTVYMGVPPANQKSLQDLGADVNAFFPSTVTVNRDQKVQFVPVGFHTVEFPKKGSSPLDFAGPSGQTIANAVDPGGAPYWFNGQPDIEINPAMVTNQGYGKTLAYNGKSQVESGLPLGQNLKPMKVKFTKTGTFTYYCNIHPGMKAKVHVVAPKAKAPSVKSDAKTVKKQAAAALKTAKSLENPQVKANEFLVGNAGKAGVEVFKFFPETANVAVGTTLTFTMTPLTRENHTATTGPGDANDPNTFLGKMSASITGTPPFDQAGIYPSDQPGTVASLTSTTHGNGFWGTGFLDEVAASPLPASGQVKIDAPGTYAFYCLIHPFMKATVTAS